MILDDKYSKLFAELEVNFLFILKLKGAFHDLRDLLSENNFGSQDEMQHLFET